MQLDQKAIRYFKRKRRGGKNSIARGLDLLLGALLLSALLFFLFWRLHMGIRAAIILGISTALALLALYAGFCRYQLEKYISKELEALKNECALEKLTLLSDENFWEICLEIFAQHGAEGGEQTLGGLYLPEQQLFCYALQNHPENPVGVQQILLLHRKLKKLGAQRALLLSPAPYQDEADAMSQRLNAEITLLGQKEFLDLEHPLIAPSEEELQKALLAKTHHPSFENPKSIFLRREKSKAYFLLGIFLLCWYGLTGFSILYPIIAALCFSLSLFCWLSGRPQSTRPK